MVCYLKLTTAVATNGTDNHRCRHRKSWSAVDIIEIAKGFGCKMMMVVNSCDGFVDRLCLDQFEDFKMVRHEDRIDRVYDHLEELPLERIETIEMDLAVLIDNGVDLQQTVAGLGTTLDHTLEQVTDLQDQLAQHQEDQYASAADAYDEYVLHNNYLTCC
ncbi:hypothetical protein CTI12_AA529340 [Artemisia annua]|uniref:Uncharacterized protein n=1 Tax=Artemisia annua TaxID=35608 RepID=A0A2U1L574_ARTAN|nr:hypothetical protein CTI12_AA529340 [Artemisia annua]